MQGKQFRQAGRADWPSKGDRAKDEYRSWRDPQAGAPVCFCVTVHGADVYFAEYQGVRHIFGILVFSQGQRISAER